MTETPTATLSNRQVADDLGLSESGVSRLRSGDRMPSLSVMQQIQHQYRWNVQDQSDARQEGAWTTRFEKVLTQEAKRREQEAGGDVA